MEQTGFPAVVVRLWDIIFFLFYVSNTVIHFIVWINFFRLLKENVKLKYKS